MGTYGTLQKIYKTRIMGKLITANIELIHIIKEEYHIE